METFNVSLVGVGGQGILLTANLLGRVAALAGLDVKKSEIHGMAQRGGSVASSVRFGERVCSPIIPASESDLLVAFDRLEALRCASQLKAGGKALVNDVYLTPVTVSSGQQPEVEDLAGSLKAALPSAVYVDAAIGLRLTRQPPCASATASADCPANVTVTFSPGAAVPHTATGLSRCSTM